MQKNNGKVLHLHGRSVVSEDTVRPLILSPLDAEQKLAQATEDLAACSERYGKAERSAARTASRYKTDFARALLATNGSGEKITVALREAQADVTCSKQHEAHLTAEAERVSSLEALRAARTRVESYRSILSSVRSGT